MKIHHPARGFLLLIAVTLIFLQSCRQDQPMETAVLTPTITSATAVNTPQTSTATPLPNPVGPTATNPPTAVVPTSTPTPQRRGEMTLGYSAQNQPITGYWMGNGPLKVVLIGLGATNESLNSYFRNRDTNLLDYTTTWFIPDFNPDNPDPASPINAHGVNLFLNADSRFSGCPTQQANVEAGGPYPFSEPESQLLRDFLADAWAVVWLTAETDTILPGGCGQHTPSNTLASILSENSDARLTASYPSQTGYFGDYLAGEGIATAVININMVNPTMVDALLAESFFDSPFLSTTPNGVSSGYIDQENSSTWRFPNGTFVHPIAVDTLDSFIYILDSGRVQKLDRRTPSMPQILLAPGDEVEGVHVIEPFDISIGGEALFVLDRAGDVYRYDPATNGWSLHRYDRPIGETSTHYFTALSAQADQQYLLESSYNLALLQSDQRPDFIWPLPEYFQIDLTAYQNQVYILSQSPYSQTASLIRYENGTKDTSFAPDITLHRPRQIEADEKWLYVLDQTGRLIWKLDIITGNPIHISAPANGIAFTAFDVNQLSGQIIGLAKDSLTFVGGFHKVNGNAVIEGTGSYPLPQIHDPAVLETLRGLLMPISGSNIAVRENQMPGAPRHYRLGVHEGADFYWQAGTAVQAVAPGTVIRATLDYQIPSQQMFDGWYQLVQSLGYTSPEAHDFYRGRQVWIEHEGGLISRYVHLSEIDTIIREGIIVQAGQIIGAVGNTGSPVSLEGPNTDAHLHFELWLNDHYLGQYLRPIETREWVKIILNEK